MEDVNRAFLYLQQGNVDAAIDLLFPLKSAEALTVLASCYSAKGDFDK